MTLIAQWNREMDQKRSATEFADIRPSDMRVFGQLRGKPTKLSDLPKKLGFSRQAARQAVERLVDHGALKVDQAEGSKRGKFVNLKPNVVT